jgi:ABC-type nitrate/sulfonate/bicarbonate transport system substrate-binding protein
MQTRRAFLNQSARFFGGAALLGTVPLFAACGDDDDDDDGAAATTAAAGTGTATTTAGSAAVSLGTVRTQFNWVPDIEWSAWYLADAKGFWTTRGVEVELIAGGPNTPAVAQVLASGSADFGVASDELQLIKANQEGADYVLLGAMYQKSPYGYAWLAETPISTAKDLVGKRIGGPEGDQLRIETVFKANGLDPKNYTFVPMSFDPQPLVDKEMDVITAYVTNQPIQLQLQGVQTKSAPFSDFGVPSYGDLLFTSKKFLDANRDLMVGYLAGLLDGVKANQANPDEVIPLLLNDYGKDAEIDEAYSKAGNPAYIALLESDYTKANGLLSIDPDFLENRVWKGYETAGETELPDVATFLDTTVLADAQKA